MSKLQFRKEVLALDQLPEILQTRTRFPPSVSSCQGGELKKPWTTLNFRFLDIGVFFPAATSSCGPSFHLLGTHSAGPRVFKSQELGLSCLVSDLGAWQPLLFYYVASEHSVQRPVGTPRIFKMKGGKNEHCPCSFA